MPEKGQLHLQPKPGLISAVDYSSALLNDGLCADIKALSHKAKHTKKVTIAGAGRVDEPTAQIVAREELFTWAKIR
jgi:hypothetical protein